MPESNNYLASGHIYLGHQRSHKYIYIYIVLNVRDKYFFFTCFVGIYVVHLYSSTYTTVAWKKSRFILSEKKRPTKDYHDKKNLIFATFIFHLDYIYIYSHPQTDCFVVSQLFSVARHGGRLNPRSKPAQLYVRLCIIPLSPQAKNVSSGIIRHYVVAFVCLHFALPDTRVLNSFEELCIMRVAAVNTFARVLNLRGEAYILSSTDRLFRCITTLHCG